MELVKLENLRDQIRIRIVMHKEYMCGYYMQPDSEYIKGFIDARKLEIIFLEKHLMAIEKEIEDHSDTKVAKALGLERVECDCEECKALSIKAKKIADTLFSAMKIKSRFDFEGKFDGDLQELQELCFKLEDDISEIEKKGDSDSEMEQKLDEALSKVKDILIEFHVRDSKYCLEVHEIIEDCYRLQDEIRRDVREDLKEKNQKYTVISFIKEGRRSDGGFDSLESAREHSRRIIDKIGVCKVEIREAGSNKLVDQWES